MSREDYQGTSRTSFYVISFNPPEGYQVKNSTYYDTRIGSREIEGKVVDQNVFRYLKNLDYRESLKVPLVPVNFKCIQWCPKISVTDSLSHCRLFSTFWPLIHTRLVNIWIQQIVLCKCFGFQYTETVATVRVPGDSSFEVWECDSLQ